MRPKTTMGKRLCKQEIVWLLGGWHTWVSSANMTVNRHDCVIVRELTCIFFVRVRGWERDGEREKSVINGAVLNETTGQGRPDQTRDWNKEKTIWTYSDSGIDVTNHVSINYVINYKQQTKQEWRRIHIQCIPYINIQYTSKPRFNQLLRLEHIVVVQA